MRFGQVLQNHRSQAGFTLVEMILALGVVGIFAGATMTTFTYIYRNGQKLSDEFDMRGEALVQLREIMSGYSDGDSSYPGLLEAVEINFTETANVSSTLTYTDSADTTVAYVWDYEARTLTRLGTSIMADVEDFSLCYKGDDLLNISILQKKYLIPVRQVEISTDLRARNANAADIHVAACP